MLKTIRLLFLIVVSPLAFAAADLTVHSFTSDKTSAEYAEPITLSARLANLGPDAATNVAMHFDIGVGYPMSVTAPAGWTCSELWLWSGSVVCSTSSFVAGAVADFQTKVLVYSKPGTQYTATVLSSADPVTANNQRTLTIARTGSATLSDLSISATPAQVGTPPGTTASVRSTVINNSPLGVTEVHLIVFSDTTRTGAQVTGSGPGWTCTSFGAWLECRRPTMGAGESSSVDLAFTSDAERIVDFEIRVIAEENDDLQTANSRAGVRVGFGSADGWKMFLLPLDGEITPGANGSLWHTRITTLIRSVTAIDLRPKICELPIIDGCFPAEPVVPLNEPFEFHARTPQSLGQYVYVPEGDAHKLNMNIRVFDAARSTTTGGAEIPFVSEDRFTSTVTSLLGIPLEDAHRYTLRVYDAGSRDGARVLINIYVDDEATPRKSIVGTLRRDGPVITTTTALLPVQPAVLQINPTDGLTFDFIGDQNLRVDVEPLDPGLRLWSFVSITNNATSHVTTVSQR